mmetsp:Transcript_21665/g.45252  ORF Transcript_21665/g.45252 Transcript_21665/m.45252 type:complete len:407 (-) Transcript_21665:72-1292(-)|eukprot:CAMPEP_0172440344 /NCGR_PEP_ID=MMETSP1065-20121228/990_1 /TAXON_ID=265537 /ORGANISM="Amphiprora paludosa, Strain CCMP125" /LENGTH=406 /DNA_ID=CAMNT_0013189133 /DNA_START=42 /DNA_END=1262 /DNA_ORIENTATION=-
MSLESSIVLLDCSEFMRNGDYVPTRLEAQQDAANLLVGAKTQAHPQSTVGVSAGTQVLVSPTREIGQILSALHSASISMGGSSQSQSSNSDLTAAVQVASLALKHRPEKNGGQRIVVFVGTPVASEIKALQKAGRQLKKNNIAIDVVAMGELETNEPKLRELVDAANGRSDEGERTCHLVTIPSGVLPSDVLASSPIVGAGGAFAAQAAAATMSGGTNNFADYGGVDPNMDPELAMALRVSMEEERARQERVAASSGESAEGGGETSGEAAAAPSADAAMAEATAADMGLSEEEALLQQALAMSMNENEPTTSESKEEEAAPAVAAAPAAEGMDVDDDDAAMQMALQMSMQHETTEESKESGGQQFQDPSFVNELLGSAEGVDTNDPEIQEALRKSKEEEDKKKEG